MANLRKCIICGNTYEYCPNCAQKSKANERWRLLYCEENCKGVSDVVNQYGHNHLTELEAQEKLSLYNLSNRDNYAENVKKVLDKIFAVKNEEPVSVIETPRPSFKSKKKNRRENIVNDNFNDVTFDKIDVVEPVVLEDSSSTSIIDSIINDPIVID